jgi:hypothetical protein
MPEREAPVPPDFAVEVKSPTDSKRELRRKAEKYMTYGTRLVWLVFPDEQVIEVYLADQDVRTLGWPIHWMARMCCRALRSQYLPSSPIEWNPSISP